MPLGLVPLIAIVAAIRLRPEATIVGTFLLIALPRSLYLQLRLDTAGFPISIQDVLPFLFLGSALELRRRAAPARPIAKTLYLVFGFFAAGLVLGTIAGYVHGAPTYQLLRVLRVEIELLAGLSAAAIAGHIVDWRRAVKTGLIFAGGLTAAEIIISVAYGLVTGVSFWGAIGLSGTVDVYGGIRSGDVNVLRSNDLSTFLILPALALALAQRGKRNALLMSAALVASLMSLSRGFWVATISVALIAVVYRLRDRRGNRIGDLIKMAGVTIVTGLLATHFVGNLASTRVNQTRSLQDPSSRYRIEETEVALHELARDPLNAIIGTGAGVILPVPAKAPAQDSHDAASFLENSLLSRWTNLSIFSAIGAVVLLIAAGRVAWRSERPLRGTHDLQLMGLCLPVVLLGGIASGADFSQGTLPFWVLAGTLLVTVNQNSTRAAYMQSLTLRRGASSRYGGLPHSLPTGAERNTRDVQRTSR